MNRQRIMGRRIEKFDILDSTNEKAKEMIDGGVEEGTVIVAARQAAGRGRYGRAWWSPPGGLYLSIVLKPKERDVHLLSLLSGLPVVRTLGEWRVEARLKWPNDVLVGEKKIGGILCEGVYRHDQFYIIVGIGLNSDVDLRRLPGGVRDEATSLRCETGSEVDNDGLLDILLSRYDEFCARFVAGAADSLLKEYRSVCTTLGKVVTIETARGRVRGRAVDVGPRGALLVESGGKSTEVYEGTVLHAK